MSYILDALRRAEAERERGSVPSVHTQHMPSLPGEDDDVQRRPVWLIAAVAVLTVALGGVLAWNMIGGAEPAARPPPQPIPIAAAPSPAPSPAPTMPLAPSPVQVMPVTPPVPSTTTTAAASPRPAPTTVRSPPPPSPAAPAVAAARPDSSRAPRNPVTTTAAAATAADDDPKPSDDRIYKEAEAPEAVRRSLPKLAFGGSSFSSAASSRMVIWNGRVFHEGDTIAPGVVLRQINRKSAVLAAKGYRVEVPF